MIIELIDVERYDDQHMMCTVDVTDEEGTATLRTAHFIPYDAAEWRIAEYELDPEDPHTVVDVLLWEAHAQAEVPEELHLANAPTVAHAREALLGAVRAHKTTNDSARRAKRMAAARGKASLADADPEAAVRQKIIALCPVDAEVIAVKREHIRLMREKAQATRPSLAADRVAGLKPIETVEASDALADNDD